MAVALNDWKTLADIFQAAVTSVAVIVGAVWTYFKFIKGRTFRPHVETQISATWLAERGDSGLLHVRVEVKNIGQAKVELDQGGTGLYVSRMAERQDPPPSETQWDDFGIAHELLGFHQWIEPGEVVTDDLLIRLPVEVNIVEVKSRVALRWKPKNIVVKTRRVFSSAPGPELKVLRTDLRSVVTDGD